MRTRAAESFCLKYSAFPFWLIHPLLQTLRLLHRCMNGFTSIRDAAAAGQLGCPGDRCLGLFFTLADNHDRY
jgi:hypothetical protein